MKRVCAVAVCLLMAFLFAASAMAAPSVEMTATLDGAVADGDAILFTLNVGMKAPSEPYASLDFNVVCSDSEKLSIVDQSAAGDRSDLDITFASGHGSAYHKGRIDEGTGAISYLIGIFSSAGGNAITDATDVCSVVLRYTGPEPQTLSLEDLKIVYKDAGGQITSVSGIADISFVIDPDTFVNIKDEEIPTSFLNTGGDSSILIFAGLALGAAAAAVTAFLLFSRGRRRKAHARVRPGQGTIGNA